MSHKTQQGVTLIELVMFIIILAILGVGLVTTYVNLLTQSDEPNRLTVANLLAKERMELITGQRRITNLDAFENLADPCGSSTAGTCTLPSQLEDYSVGSSISELFSLNPQTAPAGGSSANYKLITVTVNGPGDAGKTILNSVVARY